ncbi:LacI family DNA-binding transcriptional regulator [Brevibacillus dissolubilis]|uniref:LacI family DNA-binding transcriptional regulator n=1 Tax=Brevibacillus dissolubilis TaxID=1844116 RepID=UPI0011167030|nr:LacI family DNA-binding transcriptional regulator [Brevibacillus dissolubilis]
MTTIKDIAKKLGVSITTVSRALNGYSDVSEATKRKVLQAAEELCYRPNIAARSLVVKKTRTIGIIVSEISRSGAKDAFVFEVLCGINDRAGELGYDLVLFSTNPKKHMAKSYSDLCRERGVDGAIIMGIKLNDPYLEEVVTGNIPCVLIDITMMGTNVGYVSTDNTEGARKAVQYLIDQGHRQIGMINGYLHADVSVKRLDGYKKALESSDIPYRADMVEDGDFTEEGGLAAAYRLLVKNPQLTAIFCSSDIMAIGAMKAMEQVGKKVPEDISIIGYDNIFVSEYTSPKLTTVHQDKYEMGYQSAQLLIDMLEERARNKHVILDTYLQIRESVKPPGL